MGWKLVRDRNEAWSRAHGISGQWRTCQDPVPALGKKVLEEIGEWHEHYDPDELCDILDVLDEMIRLADAPGAGPVSAFIPGTLLETIGPWFTCSQAAWNVPAADALYHTRKLAAILLAHYGRNGTVTAAHDMKVAVFGKFSAHIEWTPLPAEAEEWR